MIKHATASVFVFDHRDGDWRLGLVQHPRLGRWMVPGGHVEPHENPAETALREVAEETGQTALLLLPATPPPALDDLVVPLPFLLVEELVPPDREPTEHIHLDHLYMALAADPIGPAELPVRWCRADELADLRMFNGTRTLAGLLFTQVDGRVGARDRVQEADHG